MSVVYFPREIFINLRRRRTYQRDRYCYPRENYETSSLISNCNIIRISSYDFSVFPIFLHAWKFIMTLYERVTAHASYGPAFRQTRQHCRRPIIRAAANSTSVHDAAQSWRTTVNWDCLVIRVNTIGKKRYFEERSANVRSEMLFLYIWSFSAVTLNIHRYNKNHDWLVRIVILRANLNLYDWTDWTFIMIELDRFFDPSSSKRKSKQKRKREKSKEI